jgi:Flp pilus assembly protein TadG
MMSSMRTLLHRRFARAEDGQAAVEFGLGASVLMMALIGMMKISLAIYTYHFIAEAAREGTRFAMVRGTSCSSLSPNLSTCPASTTDVANYVKGLGYPGIISSNMTVTTGYVTYPAGVSTSSATPGNLVTVKVQYAFPLSIPFMSNKSLTMQSTSEMIISQ